MNVNINFPPEFELTIGRDYGTVDINVESAEFCTINGRPVPIGSRQYILCYTLKSKVDQDQYKDEWIFFGDDYENPYKSAQEAREKLVQGDGNLEGWSLWTVAITQVVDYSR